MMPHIQSVVHPAGIQAARVSHLWWVMFWICAIVWCAVAVAAVVAIVRGRRGASTATDTQLGRSVAVAGGISVVALLALLFQSVVTGRALDTLRSPDALRIQVTGNQWWWDVQYATRPSLRVTTANEIHIPVGRPVGFDLLSNDVIHSLWIPNLQGKIDLVPGRLNELWLRADTAGRLSRPVRRVLRPPAREDGAGRGGRAAGRLRALAGGEPRAGAGAGDGGAATRQGGRRARPVRDVPQHRRHARRRTDRARPHAHRVAQHDRRRHAAEHARAPGRMDCRSAADQARQPHAAHGAERRRAAGRARLPGDA